MGPNTPSLLETLLPLRTAALLTGWLLLEGDLHCDRPVKC